MKSIVIHILMVCCWQITLSQPQIVGGTLTENTEWSADTIIVTEDIVVPLGINLTIQPGTVVQGAADKEITIGGSLTAIGTAEDMIVFTAIDTTNFLDSTNADGTWSGLHFLDLNEQGDSSILDFCIVEFSGAFHDIDSIKANNHGGGIFIRNSSALRISNSIIQWNKVKNGGGGIYMYDFSSPLIIDNIIRHNISLGSGGGIMAARMACAPKIIRNLIIKNYAFRSFPLSTFTSGEGSGIYLSSLSQEIHAEVHQNVLSNNFSPGGTFYDSSWETKFTSNIICNNVGQAIENGHQLSKTYIVNNTIVNNFAYILGAILVSSENLNVFNNIVYNNWYYYSAPIPPVPSNILHSDIGEALGIFRNNNIGLLEDSYGNNLIDNIDEPPSFVNPSPEIGIASEGYLYDWRLQEDDPGIDGGYTELDILTNYFDKDVYGNPRIDGGGIDIGAAEYQIEVSVAGGVLEEEALKIYPNPFSGVIWIENKSKETLQIVLHDMTGKLIHSLTLQASKVYQLNTSHWAAGTYSCQGISSNQKIVLQRTIVKNY